MKVSAIAPSAIHEVPAQRTLATPAAMRTALAQAYEKLHGRAAPPALLDTLVAQVELETGRGNQMLNWNFGGIKGAGPSGATANYMTREVLGGKEVHLQQGFRAYGSIQDGAADYLKLVESHYGSAIAPASRGDLDGFAHALKQAHYYTASEADYASALRDNAKLDGGIDTRAAANVTVDPVNDPPSSVALAHVLDAIAQTSAELAAPIDDEDSK